MNNSREFWLYANWQKSNSELASESGFKYQCVSVLRRALAPETVHRKAKRNTLSKLSACDWSKSTREIAEEFGVSRPTVCYSRYRFAPDTVRRPGRPRGQTVPLEKSPWSRADWSKKDRQLAEEFGVTKQAVNYQRRRHSPNTRPRGKR